MYRKLRSVGALENKYDGQGLHQTERTYAEIVRRVSENDADDNDNDDSKGACGIDRSLEKYLDTMEEENMKLKDDKSLLINYVKKESIDMKNVTSSYKLKQMKRKNKLKLNDFEVLTLLPQ